MEQLTPKLQTRKVEPVAELPISEHPWKFIVFRTVLIAVNPDHPPRAYHGDQWVPIHPATEPVEYDIMHFWIA